MVTITVTKVAPDTDMRGIHRMRQGVRCRAGQGVLFLNRSLTIARLVDTTHSIHGYYAPQGEVFDINMLQQMVAGLKLRLALPDGADAKFTPKAPAKGQLRKVASR